VTGFNPIAPRETSALDALTVAPDPHAKPNDYLDNVRDELLLNAPFGIGQGVARWWQTMRLPETPVAGFDPFADRKALAGYEDELDFFSDAQSPEGIQQRKNLIDGNRDARQRLAADGGMMAALTVGALDPLNYIPLPGMAGRGILKGAVRGAVGFGLSAQPTILANAALDPTAGFGEYASRTAGTIALGAAIGSAAGALSKPLTSYASALQPAKGLGPGFGPRGAPAGSPDALAPTGIGLERFDYFGQDAYTGLKNSPVPEVQRIADEVAGIPGVQTIGARGPDETYAAGVGAETRAHWWQGPRIAALRELGDIWLEYRGVQGEGWRAVQAQRAKDWMGNVKGVLSHAEFDERVGRAMHNDYKDTITDAATPFVEKAANRLDQIVLSPMGRELSAEGLIGGAAAMWQKAVTLDAKAAKVEARLATWQAKLAQYPRSTRLQTLVADIATRATKLRGDANAMLAQAGRVMGSQGGAPIGPSRGAARYAPRMWLWDKARDLPDQLHAAITAHLLKSPGVASLGMTAVKERASLILARIQKDQDAIDALTPGGRPPPPAPSGQVGPSTALVSNKFDIPSREVLDYIETSATAMVGRYIRQTAPRLELAKKFGGEFDMATAIDDLMEKIDDHFLGGPSANASGVGPSGVPSHQALKDAAAERTRVRQQIEQLRDITLGVYPRGRDPLAWDVRTVQTLKNYQILTLMGKVVSSALGDVAGVVLRERWGPLFRGTMDLIQNRQMFRLSRAEIEDFGEAAETVLGERNAAIADYDVEQMGRTWIERKSQNLTGLMFQLNGLNAWTSLIKTWHSAVAMSRIAKDARAWVDGSIGPGDAGVNDLRALGINKDTAAAIVAQLDVHGQKANSLVLPRLAQWTDNTAADHFRAAMSVTLRSGTVTPGAAERLSVQYTNIGGLAMQFMSFPISAQKRIMMAGLQRKDASTAQAIVSGIALGFFIDFIRSPHNDTRSWDERLLAAVDRSGLTGVLFSANNLIETASRDTVGIRPLLGQDPMVGETSRARQILSPSLGPTGAHMAQIIDALGPQGDANAQLGALRRSMIFQNLWMLSDIPTRIQKSIGEAIE
jgi:hypothetical protein